MSVQVNVLHHAQCFDGAASSALFLAFFRQHRSSSANFEFIPKDHRPGDPFDPSDFLADEVVCLDFRYTQDARLTWFFDHHASAFQLEGEREHFERDCSGRKFYDAEAPSCTAFIADVARDMFDFDPSPHEELVRWATLIDTAAFPDPETPVKLELPALRLMTFIENLRDRELNTRFIEDLVTERIDSLAQADYVVRSLQPILARHEQDIELLRQRCRVQEDVVEFILLDQPSRAYNKFIPYYHYPHARYLVGLTNGPDGRIKLSVGYNPWLPVEERAHDIARLCERFEGGGHPFVGGASFDADAEGTAVAAYERVVAVLRGRAS